MGALRSSQSFEAEVEEFRMQILQQQQQHHQKGSAFVKKKQQQQPKRESRLHGDVEEDEGETVCVTSGTSFLGFAIANRLLSRGYSVRLLLHTQEDLEKVREMGPMMFGSDSSPYTGDGDDDDSSGNNNRSRIESGAAVGAVVAEDMMDVDKLCEAFFGCVCVFHTSSFSDPAGVSGYSKYMAEAEARTAERVIEACVRTQSVRKCVFTSSLLACIWRQHNSPHNNRLHTIVDENCWSDESLCRDRKLWFALGKTMAEKAAWRAARGRDLKLVTLCPALVTGPGFCRRNSTASIAYLKGANDTLRDGLLATVNVGKLAEAHISIYEAMDRTARGRYICFDHVIRRAEDVAELERRLGITSRMSVDFSALDHQSPSWFELSNRKLSRLMNSSRRCLYDIYSRLY